MKLNINLKMVATASLDDIDDESRTLVEELVDNQICVALSDVFDDVDVKVLDVSVEADGDPA